MISNALRQPPTRDHLALALTPLERIFIEMWRMCPPDVQADIAARVTDAAVTALENEPR
jgi:hypothetical protein